MIQGCGGRRPCICIIRSIYGDSSDPVAGSDAITPTFFFSRRTTFAMSFDRSYSTNSCRFGSKNARDSALPSSVCATSPKKKLSFSDRGNCRTLCRRASSSSSLYRRGSMISSVSLPPDRPTYSSSSART